MFARSTTVVLLSLLGLTAATPGGSGSDSAASADVDTLNQQATSTNALTELEALPACFKLKLGTVYLKNDLTFVNSSTDSTTTWEKETNSANSEHVNIKSAQSSQYLKVASGTVSMDDDAYPWLVAAVPNNGKGGDYLKPRGNGYTSGKMANQCLMRSSSNAALGVSTCSVHINFTWVGETTTDGCSTAAAANGSTTNGSTTNESTTAAPATSSDSSSELKSNEETNSLIKSGVSKGNATEDDEALNGNGMSQDSLADAAPASNADADDHAADAEFSRMASTMRREQGSMEVGVQGPSGKRRESLQRAAGQAKPRHN